MRGDLSDRDLTRRGKWNGLFQPLIQLMKVCSFSVLGVVCDVLPLSKNSQSVKTGWVFYYDTFIKCRPDNNARQQRECE